MRLVLLITLYLNHVLARDCSVETKKGLPKEDQPLYLRKEPGGYRAVVPVPQGNSSVLPLSRGQPVILACPGTDNYLLSGGKRTAEAVCDGRDVMIEGRPVPLKEVTCRKSLKPALVARNQACGRDDEGEPTGKIYDFGYLVDESWVHVGRSCHDPSRAVTLYVDHEVDKLVESGAVADNERPTFKEGISSLYDFNINNLYKKSKQKDVIESQVYREDYWAPKDMYLSRGHLAADADYVLSNYQRATYFYVNAAPQWQGINRSNWAAVEKRVRQIAAKKGRSASVRTGTHGVLRLKDSGGVPREILLDPAANRLPVPLFFWKSVIVGDEGIVFVASNDPWRSAQERPPCRDVCLSNGWKFSRVAEKGVVTCCSLREARAVIPDVPNTKVDKILSWK